MLLDTHCHLDAAEFDADREAVIGAARAARVTGLLVPAVEVAAFGAVRALARANADVVYALGIHPMYVDRAPDDACERLRAALREAIDDPQLVAVGEIGLDFFVPGLDRERQQRFCVEQMRIAREFDLPVILHVRRSQDALLREIRRLRPRGGIAHAFNGSEQQAMQFVEAGFALGFGGAMTFTRALRIRRLAAGLTPEAHVLETDAPDIAPAWRYPGRNAPAELARIAETFAALRGESLEAVAGRTTGNAWRVLPRWGARCLSASGSRAP